MVYSARVDIYSTDTAGDLAAVGAPTAKVEVAEEAGSLAGLPAFIDTLDELSEAPFSAITKSLLVDLAHQDLDFSVAQLGDIIKDEHHCL